ncbi:hypothetical protein MRY87_13250 [bacterium]|nr:hypothetical protein [bacterium]
MYCLLPQIRIARLFGADALSYLHRRCTQDVQSLREGDCVPVCLTSAQGKLQQYFHLIKEDSQNIRCLLDHGDLEGFERDLLQFRVVERVELTVEEKRESGLHLRKESLAAVEELLTDESLVVSRDRLEAPGCDIYAPEEVLRQIEERLPDERRATPEEYLCQRILGKHLVFPDDFPVSATPLEYELHDAIAQQKGCYPGQEVIEKMRARGRPPRRLFRFRIATLTPIGDNASVYFCDGLNEKPVSVGKIFRSVMLEGEGGVALAMLRNQEYPPDKGEFQLEGQIKLYPV